MPADLGREGLLRKKLDKSLYNQYHKLMDADDIEIEEEETDSRALVAKLRERLKKCQEEKQEYLSGWQRAQADFVNARRRTETEQKEFAVFAAENILRELLPVLDSFEMAFSHKESWEKAPLEWRAGVEQIYAKIQSLLTRHHVVSFDPRGEVFNPREHISVASAPAKKKDDDHRIIAVIQKGYRLQDKLIRPAQVVVGEYQGEN